MTIDPQVQAVARTWAGASTRFPALLQAVVNAEGGIDRILPAVQCSIPGVTSTPEALEILARSACHQLAEFVAGTSPEAFIVRWGAAWAPVGVANDPTDKNVNWVPNVTRLWTA